MQSVASCTLDLVPSAGGRGEKTSSLPSDKTQSTEVFNDRRSWSAKYGTVGEDRLRPLVDRTGWVTSTGPNGAVVPNSRALIGPFERSPPSGYATVPSNKLPSTCKYLSGDTRATCLAGRAPDRLRNPRWDRSRRSRSIMSV